MAFLRLRFWVALALGLAAAGVAYYWPSAPRAVLRCERICWHFAFSQDSTRLAVLDREAGLNVPGQVLVWDVATGELLHRWDLGARLYPSRVVFGSDSQTVGLVDAGPISQWNLSTGHVVAYDHAAWSHDPDHSNREILLSATGRWLVHDTYEGRVYDVETGEVVQDYHERWPNRSLGVHGGCVVALVNDKVRTFDALNDAQVSTFSTAVMRGTMARNAWTFSADGTHGVYLGNTNEWVVHNAVNGRQCVLSGDFDGMTDCSFSRDNRLLAVAMYSAPRTPLEVLRRQLRDTRYHVHVFDTTTGAEVCSPIRDGRMAGFAPDGKTLAVAGWDRIALWDWPAPSTRWRLMLALGAAAMALAYGVGWWWSRRRGGYNRICRTLDVHQPGPGPS